MKIHCKYSSIVPIKELKPNPRNPNQHTDEQIQRLAEIIAYSGWRRPIRVSNLSGLITAGHGALEAAVINNWSEVPVDYQDYDDADQEYADMVADNSIAAWASQDFGLINTEVPTLGPDFDIKMLGIKDFEIEPMDKMPELSDAEKGGIEQITFLVTSTQSEAIKEAITIADDFGDYIDTGNSNSNGNAISRVCETFITKHGTS